MKAITAKNPHDSFSFSRRYFKKKIVEDDDEMEEILAVDSFKSEQISDQPPFKKFPLQHSLSTGSLNLLPKKKNLSAAVSKLRSALTLGKARNRSGLGTKVVGTLFGHRRGHVHFAFQEDSKLGPAFLVELATPTSVLVKEMASGLVRIALECDKKKGGLKLLEEPIWRAYCNGKKCGYAMRRECGPKEWRVLNAVGPISMGAGVLPGSGGGVGSDSDGEMMYMRARFERVVGSKDSESFYMMNPDGHGGPELSIYLLRV
ncbi:hypothetical protein CASFOL_020672 [Castilleja foliolosa]|uniref:Protein MIZU-KUSSEI 1 n=1 Tax=Castilleja foliolosa TaxID=1961234 RepID=A0ABD3D1I1_9LAMI